MERKKKFIKNYQKIYRVFLNKNFLFYFLTILKKYVILKLIREKGGQ